MMNTYETIFIFPAEIPQEKVDIALDKVKSIIQKAKGEILSTEIWGRRRLAYPIQHNREGLYVYILFSALAEAPSLLERYYRVTDTILRGLTVRLDPRYVEKVRLSAKTSSGETAISPATVTSPTLEVSPTPPSVPAAMDGNTTPTL